MIISKEYSSFYVYIVLIVVLIRTFLITPAAVSGSSMEDTLFLSFLYRTTIGRVLLKVIAHPRISKIAGWFLDSKLSKIVIPYFMKKNNITLDDIDIPDGGFLSFKKFLHFGELLKIFHMTFLIMLFILIHLFIIR